MSLKPGVEHKPLLRALAIELIAGAALVVLAWWLRGALGAASAMAAVGLAVGADVVLGWLIWRGLRRFSALARMLIGEAGRVAVLCLGMAAVIVRSPSLDALCFLLTLLVLVIFCRSSALLIKD